MGVNNQNYHTWDAIGKTTRNMMCLDLFKVILFYGFYPWDSFQGFGAHLLTGWAMETERWAFRAAGMVESMGFLKRGGELKVGIWRCMNRINIIIDMYTVYIYIYIYMHLFLEQQTKTNKQPTNQPTNLVGCRNVFQKTASWKPNGFVSPKTFSATGPRWWSWVSGWKLWSVQGTYIQATYK